MTQEHEQRGSLPQAEPGNLVDLNIASESELCSLQGIGPALATRIIQFRTEVQPFEEPVEVTAVPGISERMYRRFAHRVFIGSAPAEKTPTPERESAAGEPDRVSQPATGLEDARLEETRDAGTEEPPALESKPEVPEIEEEPVPESELSHPEEESVPELEPDTAEPAEQELLPEPEAEVSGLQEEPAPEPEPEPVHPEEGHALGLERETAEPMAEEHGLEPELVMAGAEEEPPLEPMAGEPVEVPASEPRLRIPRFRRAPKPEPDHATGEPEEVPVQEPEEMVEWTARHGQEPPLVQVVSPPGVGHWHLLLVGILSAVAGAVLALLALLLLNGTLDFRGDTLQAIQTEASRVDSELEDLGADLEDVRAQLGVVERLARRLDDMEAGLQRLGNQAEGIRTDLGQVSERLSTAQTAIGTLNGRASDLEAGADTLRSQFAEMEGSVNGLRAHLGELDASMNGLRTELGAVVESLGALSDELETVRQAAERFDAFLQGLRELLR